MKRTNKRTLYKRIGAFLCMVLIVASVFVVPLFAENTVSGVELDMLSAESFWDSIDQTNTQGFYADGLISALVQQDKGLQDVKSIMTRRWHDATDMTFAIQNQEIVSKGQINGYGYNAGDPYSNRLNFGDDVVTVIHLYGENVADECRGFELRGNVIGYYDYNLGSYRLLFNNYNNKCENTLTGYSPWFVEFRFSVSSHDTDHSKAILRDGKILIANSDGSGMYDDYSIMNTSSEDFAFFDISCAFLNRTDDLSYYNGITYFMYAGQTRRYTSHEDLGTIMNVQWYYPSSYISSFQDGYNNGSIDGFVDGYNAGEEVGRVYGFDEGKEVGYNEGKQDGQKEGIATVDGVGKIINALFEAPYRFFATWLDVELFGVNLFSLLTWIVSIALIVGACLLAKHLFF